MKDEGLEYLLSILPPGPDKSCALNLLPRALDFVRERDTEFDTADIQKFLKAGYGNVVKVIDAMIALCVIEVIEEKPIKYKRLCEKSEIQHDVYYNGWIRDADTEYDSGWDPSIFRTREEALNYAKEAYGIWGEFKKPVYVIEKIRVGNGWETIGKEEIKEN